MTPLARTSACLAFAALLSACPGNGPDAGEPDASLPIEDAGPPADPFHDPLATPENPTVDLNNFSEAATCGDCHTQHYSEWRTSMHAYAMVDPVFRALTYVRQQDFGGEQDQFCTQCHTPQGTRGGSIPDMFSFDDLDQRVLDGVSCETCHKAVDVARPYNSGLVIDQFAPMQGPFDDPVASNFHASVKSDLISESVICAACHDVVETSGLNLERPYEEYLESPGFADGRTCQECHMPTYSGVAAIDSPEREVHRHTFVGVDVPLLDGFVTEEEREEIRSEVHELLEGCGEVTLSADPVVGAGTQLDLFVTIDNKIDSHSLPTGSTFIRQMWVEVTATDAMGNVLYQTGDLDDNGDLRDAFSELDPYGDDDLLRLSSSLINQFGSPEIFTWRAAEHISNAISAGYDRVYTLFIPVPEDAVGPIAVDARLRFRSHGPYLLRALGLDEHVEKLEVVDVDADSIEVEVQAP